MSEIDADKMCYKCFKTKNFCEFAINKSCLQGRGNICYDCCNIYKKTYRNIKSNEKKENICYKIYSDEFDNFDIELKDLFNYITDKCFFSDIKFSYNTNNSNIMYKLDFDRIDRSKKYSKDNIICVSKAIKILRGEKTYDEMCKIFNKN